MLNSIFKKESRLVRSEAWRLSRTIFRSKSKGWRQKTSITNTKKITNRFRVRSIVGTNR